MPVTLGGEGLYLYEAPAHDQVGVGAADVLAAGEGRVGGRGEREEIGLRLVEAARDPREVLHGVLGGTARMAWAVAAFSEKRGFAGWAPAR